MTSLDTGRTADAIEQRVTLPLGRTISTEAAITLFGIGMGVVTALAQLYAARQINVSGVDELPIGALIPSLVIAGLGLFFAASTVV